MILVSSMVSNWCRVLSIHSMFAVRVRARPKSPIGPGQSRKTKQHVAGGQRGVCESSSQLIPGGPRAQGLPAIFWGRLESIFVFRILPPVNMGLCAVPCRRTTFLLERAFLHVHVSWWEGITLDFRCTECKPASRYPDLCCAGEG